MSENFKNHLSKLKSDVDGIVQVLEAENRLRFSSGSGGFLERLQEIDASKEALADALSEANSRFATCAARGKKAYNALLPINRLPLETLAHIFEYVVEKANFETHYRMLYQLACVSSGWNALVESSPSLWTRIDGFSPLPRILYILSKSIGMLLVARAQQTSRLFEQEDVAEALRNCSYRWHALEMSACDLLTDKLEIIIPPKLRYLSWNSTTFSINERGKLKPAQQGYRLEGVALFRVSHDFLSDAFASLGSLKYLKLHSLSSLQCTVPCLFLVLSNNPCLEHVNINSVVLDLMSVNVKELAPLSLPFLTTFVVIDVRSEPIALILQSLIAPRLKALNASVFSYRYDLDDNSEALTEAMFDLLKGAHSHFAWVSTLSLEVIMSPSGWRVKTIGIQHLGEAEGKNYNLRLRGNLIVLSPEVVLSAFAGAFGENMIEVTPVQLRVSSVRKGPMTVEQYQALHDSVPCADVLIDSTTRPSTISLCSFLGQPMDSGH